MSELYPDVEIGARNLLSNRQWQGAKEGIEETKHTPPAQGHYPDIFYWDGVFAAIINARAAAKDSPDSKRWLQAAEDELAVIAEGIRPDGFLPNVRFTEKTRAFDPERILAFGRAAMSSNYSQPPVLALGVRETFDAACLHDESEGRKFLDAIYPRVAAHYRYFDEQLSNSAADKKSGIYHPHATGRDSDPTFDNLKPFRIRRSGVDTPVFVDKLNVAIDYASILWHGVRLRGANNRTEKMRRKYWVNDVMMNGIYVDNLYEAEELAWQSRHIGDAWDFKDLARRVERQMYEDMWFPDARDGRGAFYALDGKGEPITEMSVSNLFPLVLPNLREEHLESLLELLDSEFNTPFPLPSVGTASRNYDPHNRESERLWRGPTWINTNWYVARGLWRQAERADLAHRSDLTDRCAAWANRIADGSRQLVEKSGLAEHYNPITGAAQRTRVKNFAWSNLAYAMRHDKHS